MTFVRVWRTNLTLAVLCALAASGCGDGDHGPAAPRELVSIVQDDAELLHRPPARIAATLDDLRDLGVDWVRVTAGWSVIAPEPQSRTKQRGFDARDPAAYPPHAWDALDRLHAMAMRRGLRLAVDIAFWAPRWAVAHPNADPARANERSGVDPRAYADFAEAVARRYPDTAAFTVWNEPNHTAFLLPQWRRDAAGRWQPASPAVYRAMLRTAVPRIRAAAPDALVLIGATSSLGAATGRDAHERMSPLTFARALACVDAQLEPKPRAPGCAHFTPLPGDGWSHHPYTAGLPPTAHDDADPDTVRMGDLPRLELLLRALHENGRTAADLPLYLTEFGYQTDPPDPTQGTGLGEQAEWLAEAERLARADPHVRSTAQFLVRDLPERPGPDARTRWRDYQSGLRFADGRAKPAHAAYALPLVAGRAGEELVFWGLVRPGSGPRTATIERRRPGGDRWTVLGRVRTAADGTLTTKGYLVPSGSAYRLRAGGEVGAVVRSDG